MVPRWARYRWRLGMCTLLAAVVYLAAVVAVRSGTTLACACGKAVTLPWGQAMTVALVVGLLGVAGALAGVLVCRMAKALDLDWGHEVPLEDLMEVQRGRSR